MNNEKMGLRGPKPKRKEFVWSSDFAYGVGLMASDGCLSPDGRHLLFVSKDLEQVENLKSAFRVGARIGIVYAGLKNTYQSYHRLQWGDVVLYEFFLNIGLTPNKSLTLGALKIPNGFFFDYLRGSLDGDGCFYSYYDPRWKSSFMFYLGLTSGSKTHLLWVQQTLQTLLGTVGFITTHSGKGNSNTFYQLRFAKKEATILLGKLYEQKNVMCLSRKRLKIEQSLRIVGISLPNA